MDDFDRSPVSILTFSENGGMSVSWVYAGIKTCSVQQHSYALNVGGAMATMDICSPTYTPNELVGGGSPWNRKQTAFFHKMHLKSKMFVGV